LFPGSNLALLKELAMIHSDSAPSGPRAEEIINRRAAGLSSQPGDRWPSWLAPLLGLAAVVLVVGGGLFIFGRGGGGHQVIETPVAADPTGVTTTPADVIADDQVSDADKSDGVQPSTDEADNESAETVTSVPTTEAFPSAVASPSQTLPDGRPATFWAITSVTYELVEVDTLTGDILGTYGGWPQIGGCDPDEGCFVQAIDSIDVGSDGALWITDCCEPAVGYIYRVEQGQILNPVDVDLQYGLHPELSPDQALVARSGLGQIEIVAPGNGEVFGSYGEIENGLSWSTPLAWLDAENLVIRVSEGNVGELRILDVSNPADPQARHFEGGPFGDILDADVRADGMILALLRSPDDDVTGKVYDPSTGVLVAEFDLPDTVDRIDYDASDTYLIASGSDNTVRWYGGGGGGEIGLGFVAVSW
jgi:hypothetical protein